MDFPSLYVLMTLSHHKGTVYLKDNDDDDEQSQESSKEGWSSSDKKKKNHIVQCALIRILLYNSIPHAVVSGQYK